MRTRDSAMKTSVKSGGMGDRIVIGKRAVYELLRSDPDRIERIWFAGIKDAPRGEIGALVKELSLRCDHMSGDELTARAGSDSHQGMAAILKERMYTSLSELLLSAEGRERMLVVMLDGVEDPHNVGAIMRAAECFGASPLIWSKNRGPGVTASVTKASAGGSELLPLVPVSNLNDALHKLKEAGFWVVAAALGEGVVALPEFKPPEKAVLLLGAEGRGISRLLLQESDFRVQIPMQGKIESLNVSQAASVLLFALQLRADN